MKPPRAAIVGTGFMGATHAEGLVRAGVEVVGIAGSSANKAESAAQRLGLRKAYPSYAALLADKEVDAVHITTPNDSHFAMSRDALAAGKHVLCEKPLALTAEESGALVKLAAAAAQRGQVTAVNYNVRFYPLCLDARARVARGDLGAIHGINGRYVQDWLLYPTDYNWRVRAAASGRLRAVADVGTHWVDLVTTITGLRVQSLCADLCTVHEVRNKPRGEVETFSGTRVGAQEAREYVAVDTEDQAGILLRFSNGACGALWVSQMTAGRKNHLSFELSGARAALDWNSEQPNQLWIGHRDRPNELLMKDPGLLSESARAHAAYPGGHDEGFPDTFKQCFRAFYDQIRAARESGQTPAGPSPLATFADGHNELLLCEAVLRSHAKRAWVDVERSAP